MIINVMKQSLTLHSFYPIWSFFFYVLPTLTVLSVHIRSLNPNTIPSGIDRAAFDVFRRNYWINRANDFLP